MLTPLARRLPLSGACLAILLGAFGSTAHPAPRPAWEQALALAPMVDAARPLPGFALPAVEQPLPDGWEPVDSAALDGQRGGFTVPGGLAISVGVERLVSINGEVVARTSYALQGRSGSAGAAAAQAHEVAGNIGLVQNGPGNTYLASLAPGTLGATVIQNTLNDQTIRNQTVIHASVNSATLLQSLNFNDSVGQAIRAAVRPN